MNNKKAFTVVAIFLCFILIVAVVMHFQTPTKDQTYNQEQTKDQTSSQTQDQISTQEEQKTRREFIVEVTSSGGHRCGISVVDENDEGFYSIDFESPPKSEDEATVTTEHKIKAGVGDTVIVEVLCAWEYNYARVKLVKENVLFRYTIAYESDFDRVIFRYTIKEDDL